MKPATVALVLSLTLLAGAAPTAAQDLATAEPVTSAEPAASVEPLTLCLRVTPDEALVDVDAAALLEALRDGAASIEILDPEACADLSDTPEATPEPSPEPTAEPTPAASAEPSDPQSSEDDRATNATSDGRAYADFVARGVSAAIELGQLGEKYEGAEGVRALDRAAGDLKRWAKAQIRWLDRHPPRACYADAHSQWRRGAVQIRDGSKALQNAIDRLRAQSVRRATRKLTAGVQNLVGVDLDGVSRDCLSLD